MSNSPTLNRNNNPDQVRKLLWPVAIIVLLFTVSFVAIGTYGHRSDNHGTDEFLTLSGIALVAVAAVFALVLPRALRRESSGAVALALSIVGALSSWVFWTGITPALAAGGALLGWAGLGASRGRGLSQAAFVIGLLAVIAYAAFYVLALMSTDGTF
ncbi:MAG: hypothetical protein M3Q98_09155 [Actinomycetota bacterium]|nr:hypothetical protein [Actinomycetota bacterium]